MKNIIGFSGPTYMFITPEEMYGEVGKLRACHLHQKNADIYFLSKMKKVKFETSSLKVNKDGTVEVCIDLANKNSTREVKKGKIEIIDFFYSMPHIQRHFEDKDQFFFYILYYEFIPSKKINRYFVKFAKKLFEKKTISEKKTFNILRFFYSKEVTAEYLSPYTVSINEPIAKLLTDEKRLERQKANNYNSYDEIETLNTKAFDTECFRKIDFTKFPDTNSQSLILTIDQIVNLLKIDVGQQEILYIGQTKREPFQRLFPHQKLQELTSRFLRNENEAIVIHMFGFKTYLSFSQKFLFVSEEDQITTVEAELINYFKPAMNEDYKDGKRESWKHIQTLKKVGFDEIFIELDIDGEYCKFMTDQVKRDNPNQHILHTKI